MKQLLKINKLFWSFFLILFFFKIIFLIIIFVFKIEIFFNTILILDHGNNYFLVDSYYENILKNYQKIFFKYENKYYDLKIISISFSEEKNQYIVRIVNPIKEILLTRIPISIIYEEKPIYKYIFS